MPFWVHLSHPWYPKNDLIHFTKALAGVSHITESIRSWKVLSEHWLPFLNILRSHWWNLQDIEKHCLALTVRNKDQQQMAFFYLRFENIPKIGQNWSLARLNNGNPSMFIRIFKQNWCIKAMYQSMNMPWVADLLLKKCQNGNIAHHTYMKCRNLPLFLVKYVDLLVKRWRFFLK